MDDTSMPINVILSPSNVQTNDENVHEGIDQTEANDLYFQHKLIRAGNRRAHDFWWDDIGRMTADLHAVADRQPGLTPNTTPAKTLQHYPDPRLICMQARADSQPSTNKLMISRPLRNMTHYVEYMSSMSNWYQYDAWLWHNASIWQSCQHYAGNMIKHFPGGISHSAQKTLGN